MFQLICDQVSVGYDGKAVLQNLNFTVNAGDYLCIVGENGSGKSTLMKTILGLQPPIAGKIETGDGLKQNEIGYLPQQTAAQKDFPASVQEIVLSGCQARCGLRPFYGQQQRVLLARALCATRKMLLLDEPVSGLDPKVTAKMYQLIAELNRREGISIVMISHDIAAAVQYASHILHIDDTVFFGTKEDYLKSPQGSMFATEKGGAAV